MPNDTNYFILVAADVDKARLAEPSAYQVAVHRLKLRQWGLRERTRNRLLFKPRDRILAYAAGKRENGMRIVGEAVVASSPHPLDRSRVKLVDSPTSHSHVMSDYYLELTNCRVYDNPVSLRDQRHNLSFIRNPDSIKWGNCLQNGSVRISLADFEFLRGLSRKH